MKKETEEAIQNLGELATWLTGTIKGIYLAAIFVIILCLGLFAYDYFFMEDYPIMAAPEEPLRVEIVNDEPCATEKPEPECVECKLWWTPNVDQNWGDGRCISCNCWSDEPCAQAQEAEGFKIEEKRSIIWNGNEQGLCLNAEGEVIDYLECEKAKQAVQQPAEEEEECYTISAKIYSGTYPINEPNKPSYQLDKIDCQDCYGWGEFGTEIGVKCLKTYKGFVE